MRQQNDETAADFPPVAARHAFEFLGDIFEIEAFCLAAPRALCLILQPGDKIVFIGGRVPGSFHRHSSSCKTCLREPSVWSPRLAGLSVRLIRVGESLRIKFGFVSVGLNADEARNAPSPRL